MNPQTIQSTEFSRREYCSGWPFPSPGDLPNPGIQPRSPILQADSSPAELPGKPQGESRGRPLSTSHGSDEINYPRAERMKTGNNSATSHLCNCPALKTIYLSWLLTTFADHTTTFSFFLSFKRRNRMHPFLGQPELGSSRL